MMNPETVHTPGELDRVDSLLAVELPLVVVEKVVRSESGGDGGGGWLLHCQFGPGPLGPGKATTRVHLHPSYWAFGWVGSPAAAAIADLAGFTGLVCRGTVLRVNRGAVKVGKQQRRFVAALEATVVRAAAEPWAVYKLLLDGWDLVATAAAASVSKNGNIESGDACLDADATAAAAVGAALGGCERARLLALRQQALEQHARGGGGSVCSSTSTTSESSTGGGEGGDGGETSSSSSGGKSSGGSISAGEGGQRAGRFRDVFRSDRGLRDALKVKTPPLN
jgi:uncharacterized membrane protein YgcG